MLSLSLLFSLLLPAQPAVLIEDLNDLPRIVEQLESQGDLERLGIEENFPSEILKHLYRRLTFRYYPDLYRERASAEQLKLLDYAFNLVTESYRRVLSRQFRQGRSGSGSYSVRPSARQLRSPFFGRYEEQFDQISREQDLEGIIFDLYRQGPSSQQTSPDEFRQARFLFFQTHFSTLFEKATTFEEMELLYLSWRYFAKRIEHDFNSDKNTARILEGMRGLVTTPEAAFRYLELTYFSDHLKGSLTTAEGHEAREDLEMFIRRIARASSQTEGQVAKEIFLSLRRSVQERRHSQNFLFDIQTRFAHFLLESLEAHPQEWLSALENFLHTISGRPAGLETFNVVKESLSHFLKMYPDMRSAVVKSFGARFLRQNIPRFAYAFSFGRSLYEIYQRQMRRLASRQERIFRKYDKEVAQAVSLSLSKAAQEFGEVSQLDEASIDRFQRIMKVQSLFAEFSPTMPEHLREGTARRARLLEISRWLFSPPSAEEAAHRLETLGLKPELSQQILRHLEKNGWEWRTLPPVGEPICNKVMRRTRSR